MVAVSSVLLLIIMSGRCVRYLAAAAAGNLSVDVLFSIMGYRLPGFLELVIPLGVFLVLWLAHGRLYTDSEMVVLPGCDISQNQLLGLPLVPALGVALLVGGMSLWVSPMGALGTETVLGEQRTRNEFDLVQPGRFQPLSGGASTAYVERQIGRAHV